MTEIEHEGRKHRHLVFVTDAEQNSHQIGGSGGV